MQPIKGDQKLQSVIDAGILPTCFARLLQGVSLIFLSSDLSTEISITNITNTPAYPPGSHHMHLRTPCAEPHHVTRGSSFPVWLGCTPVRTIGESSELLSEVLANGEKRYWSSNV
eukprot:3695765-Amphidinium_carterae.1